MQATATSRRSHHHPSVAHNMHVVHVLCVKEKKRISFSPFGINLLSSQELYRAAQGSCVLLHVLPITIHLKHATCMLCMFLCVTACLACHGPSVACNMHVVHVLCVKEKTRKDYAFRHQFIEKPTNIPGCPWILCVTACLAHHNPSVACNMCIVHVFVCD